MNEVDFNRLRKTLAELSRRRERLRGRAHTLSQRLLREFNCKDLKAAVALLNTQQSKHARLMKKWRREVKQTVAKLKSLDCFKDVEF